MTKQESPPASRTQPNLPPPGKAQRLLVVAGLCALVAIIACVSLMQAVRWESIDLLSCHGCHM